ncbi:MAG: hypothetical protein KBF62_01290 [Candidatus Pacebacteria bacterium]|jgi:hypothetical protein|nr:hypothetical protein [Candidatus Paceibacterota bacterium]
MNKFFEKSCSKEERKRRKVLKNKHKKENQKITPKLVGIRKDERIYVDPYGRFQMTTY